MPKEQNTVEAENEPVEQVVDGLEQVPEEDTSNEPQDIEDFHASTDDQPMEETLGNLKSQEETTEEITEETTEETTEASHEEETTTDSENGELTINLTGNMTLRLKYQYEGQDVIIGFKNHSLQVRMSDGTEFKIPVRRRNLKLVS